MAAIVLTLLIVFYAGAVLATAHAWQQVWRGAVSYSALRDVTGIGDRAALTRLFGASRPDGRYAVGFAQVLKHRRRAGVVLSDLPVHLLFLLALLLATRAHEAPGAEAVIWAAAAHAVVLGFVALSVFARSRQALID